MSICCSIRTCLRPGIRFELPSSTTSRPIRHTEIYVILNQVLVLRPVLRLWRSTRSGDVSKESLKEKEKTKANLKAKERMTGAIPALKESLRAKEKARAKTKASLKEKARVNQNSPTLHRQVLARALRLFAITAVSKAILPTRAGVEFRL